MKPNPLSRTSRLIVPFGIRVSSGTHHLPRVPGYQFPFHSDQRKIRELQTRSLKLSHVGKTLSDQLAYKSVTLGAPAAPAPAEGLLHVDGDRGARARHGVVQVVTELQ